MSSVIGRLEAIVLAVRQNLDRHVRPSPVSFLDEEIAFHAEQLERMNELHQEMLTDIVRAECYVGTDLLALETHVPGVYKYRFGARDGLKARLLQLSIERRQLTLNHARNVAQIQEKLLRIVLQRSLLISEE